MPTRHSCYGGSNASMWLNCPGGVSLRTKVPPRPAGQAAIVGTAQHEVMDMLLKDPTLEPDRFLGVTVLGVKMEVGHIAQIKLALDELLVIEETFADPVDLMESEREVQLSEEAFGTADRIIVKGQRAAIVDFKFGQEEVEADTDQGRVYSVYALASIPQFANVQEFELYIIQPAMDPATDKLVLPRTVIDTFDTTVRAAIHASKSPNPPFVEGDWCRWCDAKLVCPSKTQRLRTLTSPNHVMDLNELAQQWLKYQEWSKWMDEAAERLQHELEHGVKVDGIKLIAKRAIRQWKSEPDAIAMFRQQGVSEDDYLKVELVSPAQAEKLVPKKIVNQHASPVSSGNRIAPLSHKSPAVVPAAALGAALQKLV